MAFGDTRNAAFNRNIQRLLEYFLDQKLMKQQYGMMGEMETQRQRGYQALETQRQYGEKIAREEKYRSTMDEIFARAKASVADQPGYTYYESMFNLADQQGDDAGKRKASEKLSEIMGPAIKFYFKQQTGKEFTEKDIKAGLRAGGLTTVEKGIPERRMVSQFKEELPVRKMTAETQAGQLEQRKKEFKVEQGVGGKADQDYYRNIRAKVDGVLSYLQKLKPGGADLESVLSEDELTSTQALVGGAINPDNLGKLMSELSALGTQAMRRTLTPEEEAKIDNAYDIFGYKASLEQAPPTGITQAPIVSAPIIRKYIRDLRTNEEYWIVLRNGQWMRE